MSYLEKNKEELDRIIDEILEEQTNIDFNDKSSEFINHFFNREEAERAILERRGGKDLQQEFSEAIKKNPMVLESIEQRLDGKTKEDVEKEERQEAIDEKTEELAKEENLTREEKEKVKEEVKDEKEVTTDMLKALVVKAVYEQTLDEYHKLREDLYTGQNGQVKTGELTNGNKMDTKLIMYERYIKKLDLQYKGYMGYLITQDDDELKEKENKYFKRQQRNEKVVYEKTEKNLDRVQKLNQELNAIAEEISWRSANASLLNTEDFEREMDKLQQMYVNKLVELRELDPDIVELTRQVDEKEKNDIARDRLVGNEYERQKYKKGVIDSKNASLDEYTDRQEERIKNKVDIQNNNMNEDLISSIEEQQKMADSCFARFESTGNIEDYNEAITHLKMAEQMSGVTPTDIDEVPENVNYDVNQEKQNEDERSKVREEDLQNDKKDDMGLNRTADDTVSNLKESYRERSNEINKRLNEMRGKSQEKDENTLIRKMN